MKFNEKLIDLRKQAGLSQEELGFKLNVTRQTVSKWELGLTTPEMDKLAEISKIFNVSVDELINDSETVTTNNTVIEDQTIQSKKSSNNKWIAIVVVVVALIIIIPIIFFVLIAGNIFNIFNNFNTGDEKEGVFGFIKGVYNEIVENKDLMDNDFDIASFNNSLELYKGENPGNIFKGLLDKVIESNKTNERKITVKYNEINTQNTDEIQNLKSSLKDTDNFDVVFEYDEEGYISELKIEKIFTEFDVKRFNMSLELHAGTVWGTNVVSVLDDIITSNKTEERKITVKYNDIETQDEEEIKNIKRKFGTWDDCEITYEYDENGFINKAIIEKI